MRDVMGTLVSCFQLSSHCIHVIMQTLTTSALKLLHKPPNIQQGPNTTSNNVSMGEHAP